MNWINKLLTKNYKKVPLFWIEFNLNKFKEDGEKGSCLVNLHPEIEKDEVVINTIGKLIDYIRDNYDMEKLSK